MFVCFVCKYIQNHTVRMTWHKFCDVHVLCTGGFVSVMHLNRLLLQRCALGWFLAIGQRPERENDKQIVNYFDEIHAKYHHSLAHTISDVCCGYWRARLKLKKQKKKIDNYRLNKQWKTCEMHQVLPYEWYPNTQRASNEYNPLFEVFCLVFQVFPSLLFGGECEAEHRMRLFASKWEMQSTKL